MPIKQYLLAYAPGNSDISAVAQWLCADFSHRAEPLDAETEFRLQRLYQEYTTYWAKRGRQPKFTLDQLKKGLDPSRVEKEITPVLEEIFVSIDNSFSDSRPIKLARLTNYFGIRLRPFIPKPEGDGNAVRAAAEKFNRSLKPSETSKKIQMEYLRANSQNAIDTLNIVGINQAALRADAPTMQLFYVPTSGGYNCHFEYPEGSPVDLGHAIAKQRQIRNFRSTYNEIMLKSDPAERAKPKEAGKKKESFGKEIVKWLLGLFKVVMDFFNDVKRGLGNQAQQPAAKRPSPANGGIRRSFSMSDMSKPISPLFVPSYGNRAAPSGLSVGAGQAAQPRPEAARRRSSV